MAVNWDALDYSDPNALLAALRPAYYKLVAGEAEFEIEGADRRRVRFAQTDLKGLAAVIRDLEVKAGAADGRRRRFAMTGRFRPARSGDV